ncbi:MAG: arylsulfatase [Bryobacterales bacterium]|nr:arylsulfatase [Bryobacterales bacterium]
MTRREFLYGAPVAAWATQAGRSTPPNIVLILADDMGFSDLGCYGSEIPTPNIDRLAKGGVRFTQFYNAARCCPTRAALLTGLYPQQAGNGHMARNMGTPGYQGFLVDGSVTLGEAMRAAGYTTLMSGKWHVGAARPHWPVDRGFDESYALPGSTSNYFRPRFLLRNDKEVEPPREGYYITDDWTTQACAMLDRHAKGPRPFFLYLAYTAPHFPIQAPAEDIARYRGKYKQDWAGLRRARYQRMKELGIADETWPLSMPPPEVPAWESASNQDEWDLRMAVYAAMVDKLDQGVGRVLAKLDELGVTSNTLILLLSDNGACAETKKQGKPGAAIGTEDSHTTYEPPWANVSNTPFRYFKHWTYEGGIATPFIAQWPGKIAAGRIVRDVGHVIDVMPTLIDVAGGKYPQDRIPLEGRSLMPVLRSAARTLPTRALFWEHEGNRAVREGSWKLVAPYGKDWELYDLSKDRTETKNVAAAQPALVKKLSALYDAWAKRAGVLEWKPEWEEKFGIPY